MSTVWVVKKYRNRRLYDPHTGCYITHEEVRKLIQKGYTVRIYTHPDDVDITRQELQKMLPPLALDDIWRLISGKFKLVTIPIQQGDGNADTNETAVRDDSHRGERDRDGSGRGG